MDSPHVHEHRGRHDGMEGQVTCIPSTATRYRAATSNSHAGTTPSCMSESEHLRHVTVRLVDRISVLEARLLRPADQGEEQANTSVAGESETSLLPSTGILGMWQAYLGAGYVLQLALGVEAFAVPEPHLACL